MLENDLIIELIEICLSVDLYKEAHELEQILVELQSLDWTEDERSLRE